MWLYAMTMRACGTLQLNILQNDAQHGAVRTWEARVFPQWHTAARHDHNQLASINGCEERWAHERVARQDVGLGGRHAIMPG